MDLDANNITHDTAIHNVIRRIVQASGDALEDTSPEVVDAIYAHSLLLRASWAPYFSTNLITLPYLISVFANNNKLILLNRLLNFITVSATTSLIDQKAGEDEIDSGVDLEMVGDSNNSKTVKKFHQLCKKYGVAEETVKNLSQVPLPLSVGHQLRLLRIDARTYTLSTREYLAFAKLRQSASLSNPTAFFPAWFCLKKSVHNSGPIQLLAHLFTSCLVDLIDVALYNRRRLGIAMASPITAIEVSQASLLIRCRLDYAFI